MRGLSVMVPTFSVDRIGRRNELLGYERRRIARQRLATEEGRSYRIHREHQDQTDHQRAHVEGEGASDLATKELEVRVTVNGIPVVPEGPAQDVPEDDAADERRGALDEEVVHALGELLAVVPEAGESGQPVVEGDHGTERVDRVGDDVASGDRVHDDVEHDGDGP